MAASRGQCRPRDQERKPNGYVRIVARRSGREATAHAYCHARRQKVGVDLARAARLHCTYDDWLGMYGVSWETPGSTLWASTGSLVQTGADAGELGVDYSAFRAERRGSLSRTTTEITGTFGEYEVALRYRAGSTYLGAISDASSLCTTPDPRKIRCQDSAMAQLTAAP